MPAQIMKKEVFLAVSVGFILGLLITFGIWTANRSLKPNVRPPVTSLSPTAVPSPQAGQSASSPVNITITAPEDETLSGSDVVTLTGKTTPGAAVAVLYETGQNIVAADSSGDFSLDIKLEGGYNFITAAAYDQNGNQNTREILVTYSTSKI
jgi:hypothetical protein